ncbi:MAG: helix-turn-helix domain-containing protein [Elusimicrobiaceae bacterium]
MARTGSEKSKAAILSAAEQLFAAEGFSATSVDDIAKAAGVNKALIYYYFKSKENLLYCLFRTIYEDLTVRLAPQNDAAPSVASLNADFAVVEKKKNILTVLLMESMRSAKASGFLFETCEKMAGPQLKNKNLSPKARNKILIREFYSGIMPYLSFLIFQEKWCTHFKCSPKQTKEDFADIFLRMHVEDDK